jgi:hypothetical protein
METRTDIDLRAAAVPPALDGWRLAHAALRRDAIALARAVEGLAPATPAAVSALCDAARLAGHLAHLVRMFEDGTLFPAIVHRRRMFRDTLLQFAAEHAELDDLHQVVVGGLTDLAGAARPDEALRRVTHDVVALRELSVDHLDREVRASVAPLDDLDPRELEDIAAALIASVDAAACAGIVLPWLETVASRDRFACVLASCTDAMRAAHLAGAPAFRALYAPLLP